MSRCLCRWWVLVPAVLTHGFYDSALFTIGTISAGEGEVPDPQRKYSLPRSQQGASPGDLLTGSFAPSAFPVPNPADDPDLQPVEFSWASMALFPIGWVYLAIPAYWLRKKLIALDLAGIKARLDDGESADMIVVSEAPPQHSWEQAAAVPTEQPSAAGFE
jgi:hypothetical protein